MNSDKQWNDYDLREAATLVKGVRGNMRHARKHASISFTADTWWVDAMVLAEKALDKLNRGLRAMAVSRDWSQYWLDEVFSDPDPQKLERHKRMYETWEFIEITQALSLAHLLIIQVYKFACQASMLGTPEMRLICSAGQAVTHAKSELREMAKYILQDTKKELDELFGVDNCNFYPGPEAPKPAISKKVFTVKDIQAVMEQYPLLNNGGATMLYEGGKTWAERRALQAEWRADLLRPDTVRGIKKACDWIQEKTVKRKGYDGSGSYGWKHVVERDTGYITNGQFIVAALLCGYKMERDEYNPRFNIQLRTDAELQAKKTRNKFYRWLKAECKDRNDPVGDFAKDALYDDELVPATRTGWVKHLDKWGACDAAREAFDEAWGEYKKQRKGAMNYA